jgi:DNA-binding PadR family transcriptional regulator
MHGYELKATLESWGTEWWTDIAYGSIYFALKKMTVEGLLTVERTEPAGARPARTIYAITDEGRREFQRLVRELWWTYEPTVNPFAVAITFVDALPADEAAAALRSRIAGFEQALAAAPYFTQSKRTLAGPAAAAAVELGTAQARAELDWLRETLAAIERGDLATKAVRKQASKAPTRSQR